LHFSLAGKAGVENLKMLFRKQVVQHKLAQSQPLISLFETGTSILFANA
jgi:hypothetical protein